jgi:hypothetical protein
MVLVLVVLVVLALRPGAAVQAEPGAVAAAPALGHVPTTPLRFFVVGDAPYSDAEQGTLERLLSKAVSASPPFIVHVGDIKGGGQPCSDARNRKIARLFASLPVPVLYTPGDNEWTDCHRRAAGRQDPLARLRALRETFFADPEVLHNASLDLVVPDQGYPENAYFLKGGVAVVLLHLVGSENNRRPRVSTAMQEWRARSAANRGLLAVAAEAAKAAQARAMVLLFHANPGFEQPKPKAGFQAFFDDLAGLLDAYPGPILAVHGDTHRFQFNQPLHGDAAKRFWRLEVPGSPFVGGVWVNVTGQAAEPFGIEVVWPSAASVLEAD